jgi:hypothetical protein
MRKMGQVPYTFRLQTLCQRSHNGIEARHFAAFMIFGIALSTYFFPVTRDVLFRGEQLFLYSDGVWEMDAPLKGVNAVTPMFLCGLQRN